MTQLRRWEELNKEFANKGLRFFTAYSGSHPLATMEAKIKDLGLTLPVAADGYYKSRFTAGVLCVIWVIGVDGKVVHVGQEGWEAAALKELKKVKYPGLGMSKISAPLETAAKAFGEGKLAEADRLAEAVESGDFEDNVIDEAGKIRERVRERRKLLESRADNAEVCADYDLSLACWNELAARFGEVEYERSPKEEVARISKLADFEAEREARRVFIDSRQKAWAGFDGIGNDEKKIVAACVKAIKIMQEFMAANKDRRPVSAAEAMIEDWKAWREELQPKPPEEKK